MRGSGYDGDLEGAGEIDLKAIMSLPRTYYSVSSGDDSNLHA